MVEFEADTAKLTSAQVQVSRVSKLRPVRSIGLTPSAFRGKKYVNTSMSFQDKMREHAPVSKFMTPSVTETPLPMISRKILAK
jgi:hypothetical protein